MKEICVHIEGPPGTAGKIQSIKSVFKERLIVKEAKSCLGCAYDNRYSLIGLPHGDIAHLRVNQTHQICMYVRMYIQVHSQPASPIGCIAYLHVRGANSVTLHIALSPTGYNTFFRCKQSTHAAKHYFCILNSNQPTNRL